MKKETKSQNIIYQDGKGVTITALSFRVRNTLYPLDYITGYGISIIQPKLRSGMFMIVLGICVGLGGMMNMNEIKINEWHILIPTPEIFGGLISPVELLEGIALIFFLTGITVLLLARERYVLWINVGGQKMGTIVSCNKNYIEDVARALSKGLKRIVDSYERLPRSMSVSGNYSEADPSLITRSNKKWINVI